MFKFLTGLTMRFCLVVLMSVSAQAQSQNVKGAGVQPPANQNMVIKKSHEAFGSWIFGGKFADQSFLGFNPTYEVAIGDTVSLQLWGGFEFAGDLVVDAQGNIFVPKVGPVKVQGVMNKDLNAKVTAAIKNTFRKNVGVYASLGAAEPVKVFVTGFVEQPGLYAGHSSDSVLYFLDKAGGIDPQRGSFLDVQILRGGALHRQVNLYDFIFTGAMPIFQISDGDTLVIKPVKSRAGVFGNVQNPYLFEFENTSIKVEELLALARPFPQATHVRISRNNMQKTEVEYLPLAAARDQMINSGDVLEIMTDKNQGTISVRVEGAHQSSKEFVLPYGASLGELLERVHLENNAEIASIQLLRQSVKFRQKEMLDAQLRALESSVLTARSNTSDEAALRTREAELILQWVERARLIEPKGQVTLAGAKNFKDILLEPDDIINIPRRTNLVMVHGDVLFPSAMAYQQTFTVNDYIKQAGGFTQNSGSSNVLILRRDGSFLRVKTRQLKSKSIQVNPGDEVFILPRVATKHLQIAKDVISVIYQVAVSAGVLIRL